MIFKVGELIETKKPHSCKANKWLILRVGVDVKIKCTKCGREIILQKYDLEKKVRN